MPKTIERAIQEDVNPKELLPAIDHDKSPLDVLLQIAAIFSRLFATQDQTPSTTTNPTPQAPTTPSKDE